MSIKTLLSEEVKEELEILKKIGVGSNDHKLATDDLTKLVDRVIVLEKTEIERKEHELKRKEHELKLAQMKEDQKDQLIKNCIAIAGIVIPVGVTIWGTLASFKFETEGTVTTIMGRGFINKLLPKK